MAKGPLSLPFRTSEYDARAQRLRARLEARGLDAIVLSGP